MTIDLHLYDLSKQIRKINPVTATDSLLEVNNSIFTFASRFSKISNDGNSSEIQSLLSSHVPFHFF